MSSFWCHECVARVETRVDAASQEVCCLSCGGNFVEEIEADDPPESFAQEPSHLETQFNTSSPSPPLMARVAPPRSGSVSAPVVDAVPSPSPSLPSRSSSAPVRPISSLDHDELMQQIPPRLNITQLGVNQSSRRNVTPMNEPDGPNGSVENSVPGPEVLPLDGLLRNLLGGRGNEGGSTPMATTATFSNGNGLPLQVFFNDGDNGDFNGFFNAIGGMFNAPVHGNLGDYAFGNISNIINQLMQNDPNRHGAPPASKEAVENLPTIKMSQTEINAKTECAVCKDTFSIDEEAKLLPCTHPFHPDCILPWLKQHNSCPVCRHELPTDDEDYELRRRQQEQQSAASASSASS